MAFIKLLFCYCSTPLLRRSIHRSVSLCGRELFGYPVSNGGGNSENNWSKLRFIFLISSQHGVTGIKNGRISLPFEDNTTQDIQCMYKNFGKFYLGKVVLLIDRLCKIKIILTLEHFHSNWTCWRHVRQPYSVSSHDQTKCTFTKLFFECYLRSINFPFFVTR